MFPPWRAFRGWRSAFSGLGYSLDSHNELRDSENIVNFHPSFDDRRTSPANSSERSRTMTEEGKPVSASRLVLAQVMTPQDANIAGNVHGGDIMKLADTAAAVVAIRHSGCLCVTASVDRFDFHAPVYVGNLLTLHASLNHVGRTSMEVGVRVEAEDLRTGKKTHTNSCYFTMGALAM